MLSGLIRDKALRRKVRDVLLGNEVASADESVVNVPAPVSVPPVDDFIQANGIIDFGDGFKRYFLRNNVPEKTAILKRGLDEQSQKNIDMYLERMVTIPDNGAMYEHYRVSKKYWDSLCTEEEGKWQQEYCRLHGQWQKDFLLPKDAFHNADVYLFHHGLKYTTQNLKNYIAGKDFVDGGAYIGDSAIMLAKLYNPKKIYAFEISDINGKRFIEVMKTNNISEDKFELVLQGLSDSKKEAYMNDTGDQGGWVAVTGDTKIELTDLDSFAKEKGLHVGFVKADLESAGVDALKGMLETIKKDRPVLSLATYHTPEEFFDMKPILEEAVKELNYTITIQRFDPWLSWLAEIAIFAYPKELDT